jgi:hypothetical protein
MLPAEISFTRIEIASAPAVEQSDSLERCERWSVSETRSTRFRMDCGWQLAEIFNLFPRVLV